MHAPASMKVLTEMLAGIISIAARGRLSLITLKGVDSMVANVYRKLSEGVGELRSTYLAKLMLALVLAFAVGVAGVGQAYANNHHHSKHHHYKNDHHKKHHQKKHHHKKHHHKKHHKHSHLHIVI